MPMLRVAISAHRHSFSSLLRRQISMDSKEAVSRLRDSGNLSRRKLSPLCTTSFLDQQFARKDNVKEFKEKLRRCSSLSKANNCLVAHAETLNYIKSVFNQIEGPTHYWLNYVDKSDLSINQDGIVLVLVNACFGGATLIGCRERVIMFEKTKLLQQRHPKLNIFGLECGGSAMSVAKQARIIQTVMEEYITYPLLISDENFTWMTTDACWFLFEGSTNRLLCQDVDLELDGIVKLIRKLDVSLKDVPQNDDIDLFLSSNGDRWRQHEVIKEPCASSAFRNLLLYHPGCVSVDEDGNRIFISDGNHHRIIVSDSNGKILDCIGSSPGFEDGEFETAKLLRPAASFYDVAEDCLYFVDSENDAIRRADMKQRALETMFPASVPKTSGVWSWILHKLGLARKEVDVKSKEFNLNLFAFPWHLLRLGENDLIIINRSFEISWIINMKTWEITKSIRGIQNILQNYGNIIAEKASLLSNAYENSLPLKLNNKISVERIPYAGLISSVADFHGYTIFCDAAAHRVLKCHRESKIVSGIEFSNFRVLGLPHWLICPLETVFNSRNSRRRWKEHLHHFSVLPGRCDIRVKVELPKGVELVAPLEEGCVWRQARGSVAELSGSDDVTATTEKVGVAQQWFDELDNLAFSKVGNESVPAAQEQIIDGIFQDECRTQFDCAVNVSPGTGEVVVSAVLYVKLGITDDSEERATKAARILNLQNHSQRNPTEEACISLLLDNVHDFQNLVFTKPLYLRIRLDCRDHPTTTTQKEIILTDTALEINVTLD